MDLAVSATGSDAAILLNLGTLISAEFIKHNFLEVDNEVFERNAMASELIGDSEEEENMDLILQLFIWIKQ